MSIDHLKPCTVPGCPGVTMGRYCAAHARTMGQALALGQAAPIPRGEARYLREHPLCEPCAAVGKAVIAEHVVMGQKLTALCPRCYRIRKGNSQQVRLRTQAALLAAGL